MTEPAQDCVESAPLPERVVLDGTRFITRRVVQAWQLRNPAPWIGDGSTAREMPRGTWVVESVETGRRWPVSADLFPRKYRMMRPGQYLNTESVTFEPSSSSGNVRTAEGSQSIPTDGSVLIAVGESGDRWPVHHERIEAEYLPDTVLNRVRLLFRPGRRRHLAVRASALLSLLFGTFLVGAALVVVPAGSRTPLSDIDVWARELVAIAVVLAPMAVIGGIARVTQRLRHPSLLLLLLASGVWLIILAFLLAIRRGAGFSESLLAAARVFNDVNKFRTYSGAARQIALTISVAAATIALLSFAAIARTLLRDSWDRISARLRSFDVVVWGLGETAMRLLQSLRADVRLVETTGRVIVIEQDRQNPYIQIARSLGVPVVIGDEQSTGLLRQVAVTWLRRRWTPRYLLGLTGDETANLMLPELVATVRGEARAQDPAFVSLRVENPWTRERLFTSGSSRASSVDVSTVSAAASNAETVMRMAQQRGAQGQSGPLVIVGDSPLGVAVVEAARRERLLEQTLSAAAGAVGGAPVRALGWNAVHWVATTTPGTWAAAMLPSDIQWHDDSGGTTGWPGALEVCTHVIADDAHGSQIVDLVMRLDAGTIVLCDTVREPVAIRLMHMGADRNACLCFIEVAGNRDRRYDSKLSGAAAKDLHGPCVLPSQGPITLTEHLHGELGAIAAVVHEYFRVTRRSLRDADSLDDQLWDSPWLPTSARAETYRFVERTVTACQAQAGLVVRPLENQRDPSVPSEWSAHIEALAQAEHEDWCETKAAAGFIFGPERDDQHKTHDLLVPWNALSTVEQERNLALFLAFPKLLIATRRVLTPEHV